MVLSYRDLTKIQDGIGEKVGLFVSYISISICSLATAFYFGWELALITLVALPILTITAGIVARIIARIVAGIVAVSIVAVGVLRSVIVGPVV